MPRCAENHERLQCNSVRKELVLLACVSLTLSGCGFSAEETPLLQVSGGKSATVVLDSLINETLNPRPSGTLGIFASLYLAERLFLPTRAATQAIDQILNMVRGQEQPVSDETFALLQTLGDALSVNVVDLLNRSENRLETLDQYVNGLTNASANGKRRNEELTAALEIIATQKKEQRTVVRTIEQNQKAALKAKDYSLAGTKEAELTKAQTTLSETELKESQMESVQKQFKNLLKLADKRLLAIERNRELLLSGLTITDPDGLEDLGLVRETAQ